MSKSKQPAMYVESDGRGPYLVLSRNGRVATIESTGFSTNGTAEDWKRARRMAKAWNLLNETEGKE